ncbi:MAG: PAS domain S-box protein [Euryarchaeota archaeon]|nr:PAS domain S-box protein [Euryarchaeota archaeon]
MNLVVTSILRSSYSDIENDMGEVHISQTMYAVEEEEANLRLILMDYSNWDDTYDYMTDQNSEFIDANFIDTTYENFHLSDVVIFNTSGGILYAEHYDEDSGSLVPISASLDRSISEGGNIFDIVSVTKSISGFMDLDGRLTVFACSGIYRGDESGPLAGFIWFSQTIDGTVIEHISDLTSYEVSIEKYDGADLIASIGSSNEQRLRIDGRVFIEESDDIILLYGCVDDYQGNPLVLITTPMDREIARQGEATLELMQFTVILLGALLLVIIMLLMEVFAVRRVVKLDRDVDRIGKAPTPGERVGIHGKDEISALSSSINNMLDSLEHAQEITKTSEIKHKEILADLDEMVFRFDKNFTVTFANESFWRYYGKKDEDDGRINVLSVIHPDDLGKIIEKVRSMNEQNTSVLIELRCLNKDKELRWQQWTIRPIIDEKGAADEFQSVAQDITEQKKANDELNRYKDELEERVDIRTADLMNANQSLEDEIERRRSLEKKLVESQKRYQAVVEDQTELIVRTTPSGTITFMNEAFLKYFGMGGKSPVNHTFVPNIMDEDASKYATFMASLDKDHPVGMIEYRVVRKDEVRWQQWNYRMLFDEEGAPSEVQGVGRDITHWKHMESEVAKANTLESLGMLAGGMAHEFNNVLTSVLGNITLAKKHLAIDDPLYTRLAITERSVYDAQKLTDSILTFADGGEPIKETLNIEDLLRRSGKDLTTGSDVVIHYSVPRDTWNIEGDRAQLVQAIRAILKNAVESMVDGGSVDVVATNVEHSEIATDLDGHSVRYVMIEVADKGYGISKESLPHIFDPYYSTKRSSGLGLSTALSIVKRHHGAIDVSSIVNVGSKFTISLPATDQNIEQAVTEPEDLVGSERILLMDDDEGVLEVGQELLRVHGFEVDGARTGEEAMDMYVSAKEQGRPYDLVIMDLTVKGGKGGKETVKELLAYDPDVRAIVSSGYSKDPVMAHYQEFGFKGVVKKPYLISEMTNEIRRVLDLED